MIKEILKSLKEGSLKHSIRLYEAGEKDEDDVLGDLGLGGDDEKADSGGGDEEESSDLSLGDEPEESEEKEDSSDSTEDDSDSEDAVDDQKKEVEAKTIEETDDDSAISLDMKIEELFIKEETRSLNSSNQEQIVVGSFAQGVVRIADNFDKLISVPEIVYERARRYIKLKYGEAQLAEFDTAIEPQMKKYMAGGTDEYYLQNRKDYHASGSLSDIGSGGSL